MNSFYCQLEQDALLHISGPDSLKFLQGQTTCDTRIVDAQHAIPGAFCTPQGRVVCDFLIAQLDSEHFCLRMRRDIVAASSAAFGKYIIFSKAQLEPQRDDWQALAIWGDDAAAVLHELLGEQATAFPAERFAACSDQRCTVVQVDTTGQQFECFLHNTEGAELLARLEQRLEKAPESVWQGLQIEQGVARIEAATMEEFVPQILNYDLTGHISFKKGCYTGQEVVARLHYRGKPKRRTYLAHLNAAESIAPGTQLYADEGEQSVGHVVNSAVDANITRALVAATASGVASGLHIGSPDGPLLELRNLPYAMETP